MKICFGKNNMDQKINLIFFDCSKSIPLVNGLIKNYTQSNKFEVESLDNINEINQLLQTSLNGILFFKVENKVDLQKAVSILKAQKKLVKKGLLKPACITNLKNKKMETILSKYGCVDILEPETATKTVSFKLDFWSKPISAHLEQVSREEKLKLKKQQETKEKNEKEKPKEDFLFVNSLDLESDFWIIKHKNDCKKILRRWLVRILGPSPFIGNWVELQARPGDKLPTWKFVLKDPNNTDYIKNEGAWYFYGSKPEFDWKINRWSFSSDLPHLYFYTKDQKVFSRFKFINGSIEVCENSDFALAREEMILETCDAKYNFDAEKNAQQESKDVEGADEQDDLENLKGKASTDQLNHDPLSGKVNPGEELSEAERKKAGYSEDPIPGHMGGKSSTDQLNHDPLSGKVNPGEELSEAERKKAGYSEDPIPGHMGGKSSTDQLDGDPLSGKVNPSEELSEAERKKAGYSEDPIPGHMGGEASTDQLDHDPLSGELDSKNTHKEAGTPIVHSQEEDKNTGGHSDVDLNHGQRATPPQGDEQQHDDLSEYGIMKGVGKTHQHDEQEDFDQENFENTGPDLSQIIDNAKKDSASSVDYDPNAIVDNSLTDFDEEGQKAGVINYNEPSSEKEEEILDALGGGLTKSQSSGSYEQEEKKSASAFISEIPPEKNKEKTQLEELNEVFANEVNVNLESGELKVVLKQKTNIGNDITFICEFEDFYEDELIVKAPLNSLATQTRVAARVSLFYNGHKAKVECLGTIEEKESLNESQETLIINIEKIDLKKYNEFIELYQKRQGNINDFLSMAKGY